MNRTFITSSAKRTLFTYARLLLGNLLVAIGFAVFILPYDLNIGGMSGIALVLAHSLPWEFLTVDRWILLLSWGFFAFGWIALGRHFAMRTLFSTIVYPTALSFFSSLASPTMLGGIFHLESSAVSEGGVIVAALFGGVLVGCGCAICYLSGGSTGGLDILALWIAKKLPRIKKSSVVFALDATAILLGFLVGGDLLRSLLGILAAFLCAFVIERMFLGSYGAYVAQILSSHYAAINQDIIARLHRTSTLWDAVGGFRGAPQKMLQVSFRMSQYPQLLEIIEEHDPSAFVIVQQAHAINGNGWTRDPGGEKEDMDE